jgi:hypothetical protein
MDSNGAGTGRRQGVLLLLAVFLLGLVCGASLLFLGQRSVGLVRGPGPRPVGPPVDQRPGHLLRELDLDEEQREKVFEIMREDRERIHGILEETRLEIRALLRPEQQEIFDRMRPEGPGFGHRRKGGRRGFRRARPDVPGKRPEAPPPPPPGAPGPGPDDQAPPPPAD